MAVNGPIVAEHCFIVKLLRKPIRGRHFQRAPRACHDIILSYLINLYPISVLIPEKYHWYFLKRVPYSAMSIVIEVPIPPFFLMSSSLAGDCLFRRGYGNDN